MDLATLSMDAVRQMDDAALRRVIAELLGWRVEPDEFHDGCAQIVNPAGDVIADGYVLDEGETADQAGDLLTRDSTGVPDWPTDLNAAVALLPLDYACWFYVAVARTDTERFWSVQIHRPGKECEVEELAPTLARAICLAWVALRLAQQEATHENG